MAELSIDECRNCHDEIVKSLIKDHPRLDAASLSYLEARPALVAQMDEGGAKWRHSGYRVGGIPTRSCDTMPTVAEPGGDD